MRISPRIDLRTGSDAYGARAPPRTAPRIDPVPIGHPMPRICGARAVDHDQYRNRKLASSNAKKRSDDNDHQSKRDAGEEPVALPLKLALEPQWQIATVVIVFQSLVELFGMVAYLWLVPRFLAAGPSEAVRRSSRFMHASRGPLHRGLVDPNHDRPLIALTLVQ